MKKNQLIPFLPSLLLSILLLSCNDQKDKEPVAEATSGHPAWSAQSNIYEINLRQFTKEGTITAFENAIY